MKPFCTRCQAFMKPTNKPAILLTDVGPVWDANEFTCPFCQTTVLTDWPMNARQLDPPTYNDLQKLRRQFFPHIYFERSK